METRTVRGVIFYAVGQNGEELYKRAPDDQTMLCVTPQDLDALAIVLTGLECLHLTSLYYRTGDPVPARYFRKFEKLGLVESYRLTPLGTTWCRQLYMEGQYLEDWSKIFGGLAKVQG
jgi:hypothetical protein